MAKKGSVHDFATADEQDSFKPAQYPSAVEGGPASSKPTKSKSEGPKNPSDGAYKD